MFEGEGVYLATPRKRTLFSIDVVEEQVNIIKNYLWKLQVDNYLFLIFHRRSDPTPIIWANFCGKIIYEDNIF